MKTSIILIALFAFGLGCGVAKATPDNKSTSEVNVDMNVLEYCENQCTFELTATLSGVIREIKSEPTIYPVHAQTSINNPLASTVWYIKAPTNWLEYVGRLDKHKRTSDTVSVNYENVLIEPMDRATIRHDQRDQALHCAGTVNPSVYNNDFVFSELNDKPTIRMLIQVARYCTNLKFTSIL